MVFRGGHELNFIRTKKATAFVLAGLLLASVSAGCQNASTLAKQRVAKELARRAEARAKSQKFYEEGLAAYREGEVEKAQQSLSRSVQEDDHNAAAWMALGVVEFQRDRLYEAARAFHRSVRLAPLRYEPHFNLGQLLESVGRVDEAIREYQIALECSPDQLEVMENLARCYLRRGGSREEARELIRRARMVEYRPEWVRWLESQQRTLDAGAKGAPTSQPAAAVAEAS